MVNEIGYNEIKTLFLAKAQKLLDDIHFDRNYKNMKGKNPRKMSPYDLAQSSMMRSRQAERARKES